MPESQFASPQTNVIIRWGEPIARRSISQDAIRVIGSASGVCAGRVHLSDDEKTILWTPASFFKGGERVTVEFGPDIRTVTGRVVPSLNYSFVVSPGSRPFGGKTRIEKVGQPQLRPGTRQPFVESSSQHRMLGVLPPDFPVVTVLSNTSQERDQIFLSSFTWGPIESTPYLMILDRNGDPVFYRKGVEGYGFTVQPGGMLTYFDVAAGSFVVLDSAYHQVDRYECGNGYATDNHDFVLLPNGHALLIGYDYQLIGMDTVIEGGDPSALVKGNVIQELDRDKNVVFQWLSWDHFKITDALRQDLTAPSIDPVHANSIDLDKDGALLLSSRNMDEITKIDRGSGEIVWRLGGKNSRFTFVNDSRGFQQQHTARWLPDGHILLFDNGFEEEFSRAVEYVLNETDSIATLVWKYRPSPDIFGWSMGSIQRLANGNTLVGWGSVNPTLREVTQFGETVYELNLPEYVFSYRAYSFPWKTNAFVPSADSLLFPDVAVGDSLTLELIVANPTLFDIQLTSFSTRTSVFQVSSPAQLDLSAGGSVQLRITMLPSALGLLRDTLDIRSEDTTQGIVRRVLLRGASPPPTIATSPTLVDFGTAGHDSTLTLRIMNSSVNVLVIDSAYTTTPQFSINRSHCSVRVNDTIDVTFHPTTAGRATDTLYLLNNSLTPRVAIPLEGSFGISGMTTSATLLDFGVIQTGDSSTMSVTVRNTGTMALTISNTRVSGATFLSLLITPTFVQAGDSVLVAAKFRPVIVGVFSDTLFIVSSAGSEWVALRGESRYPTTGIVREGNLVPSTFTFPQNYPNPFNGTTTIMFGLPVAGHVFLSIYDVTGREVAVVGNADLSAGYYRFEWSAGGMASGIYFCRITATQATSEKNLVFRQVRKVLLMK